MVVVCVWGGGEGVAGGKFWTSSFSCFSCCQKLPVSFLPCRFIWLQCFYSLSLSLVSYYFFFVFCFLLLCHAPQ